MWGFWIAVVSGALMSVQGVWNAGLTKASSTWLAASYVQITAFVVCLIAWWITGFQGNVTNLFTQPHKYMLLTGVLGAFITITVIQSVGMLGPARASMFIVASQVLCSYLIELFGLFQMEKVPFSMRKCVGIVIIIAGIITFKWH